MGGSREGIYRYIEKEVERKGGREEGEISRGEDGRSKRRRRKIRRKRKGRYREVMERGKEVQEE